MQSDHTPDLLNTVFAADRELAAVSPDDPYGLYETAHRIAGRIAAAEVFYICLYAEDSGTLYFPYNFDGVAYDDPVFVPLGEGPTSWVIREQRAYVLAEDNADIHERSTWFGDTTRRTYSAAHFPMRSALSGERDRVLGVLCVQAYEPNAYGPEAVSALQWLADRVGIQVEYALAAAHYNEHLQEALSRAAERERQSAALAAATVQKLQAITKKVEALRTPGAANQELRGAVEQLCRLCYSTQTEVSSLALSGSGWPAASHETPNVHTAPKELALTMREQEVLDLLAGGATNAQIAGQLSISENTVKFHCKRIFEKLGIRSRFEAMHRRPRDQEDYPKGR